MHIKLNTNIYTQSSGIYNLILKAIHGHSTKHLWIYINTLIFIYTRMRNSKFQRNKKNPLQIKRIPILFTNLVSRISLVVRISRGISDSQHKRDNLVHQSDTRRDTGEHLYSRIQRSRFKVTKVILQGHKGHTPLFPIYNNAAE